MGSRQAPLRRGQVALPHLRRCSSQALFPAWGQESQLLHPSLSPARSPRLHRHPPVCTACHSKLEHASLGSTSKPPTHPRGSPAGPVAAQRALPQELLLQRQGKPPEGFSHQDICFPVVPSPFQAPRAPSAACLHSQAQRRLKNNRQETCVVPKHFSALPKG